MSKVFEVWVQIQAFEKTKSGKKLIDSVSDVIVSRFDTKEAANKDVDFTLQRRLLRGTTKDYKNYVVSDLVVSKEVGTLSQF